MYGEIKKSNRRHLHEQRRHDEIMYASRTADKRKGAQELHDEDIQQTVIAQMRLERKQIFPNVCFQPTSQPLAHLNTRSRAINSEAHVLQSSFSDNI